MTIVHLLIIDPQNSFMDTQGAELPVSGASADMKRLATLIDRVGTKLDDIHVTLDTHHLLHIAHPFMWVNSRGENPPVFTTITTADVRAGVWRAKNPAWQTLQAKYVESLEQNKRFQLCIWPPHCLIGSWGHNVEENVYKALLNWETVNFGMVNYVTKGSNLWTEHYSGLQAEVQDPNDPTTSLNIGLIKTIQTADIIAVAGEALSHCVANTVRDIANNFGSGDLGKFVLLEDCSSPVAGFEKAAQDFVAEMRAKGMKVMKSTDFLA